MVRVYLAPRDIALAFASQKKVRGALREQRGNGPGHRTDAIQRYAALRRVADSCSRAESELILAEVPDYFPAYGWALGLGRTQDDLPILAKDGIFTLKFH